MSHRALIDNYQRMISTITKRLFVIAPVVFIFLNVTVSASLGGQLLFEGLPPSGEQYYTASLECSNVDGYPGAELVITDDFGAFQILAWDPESGNFKENWVSDRVFETNRVKKIFLPYNCAKDESIIVFIDTADDLRIFHWREYIVTEIGIIHLSSLRNYSSISDFLIADFLPKISGWELLTLQTYIQTLNRMEFPIGFLNVGQFNPGFTSIKTSTFFGLKSNSQLFLDHHKCPDAHGVIVVSKSSEPGNKFTIFWTKDPISTLRQSKLSLEQRAKIGWIGEIDTSGNSYLTCFIRSEDKTSRIQFHKIARETSLAFEVEVPLNTSKWVLGDIDGNGLRELIVLDFLGKLYVYDLKDNLLKGAN
jgi:hypothetical protein